MRKLLAILLLLCLAAPFVGTYAWLMHEKRLAQKAAKKEVLLQLDETAFRIFKFTQAECASQVRWEHAEEFEYQGQMYDVVERWQMGDTLVYKCWWDRKETQVNAELDDLINKTLKQHPPNSAEHEKRLQQFLTFLFFDFHTFPWYFRQYTTEVDEPTWYHSQYALLNRPPLTPPPK